MLAKKLLLDVFYPKSKASTLRLALIWVHGGGWSAGNKEGFAAKARALAQQVHLDSIGAVFRLRQ